MGDPTWPRKQKKIESTGETCRGLHPASKQVKSNKPGQRAEWTCCHFRIFLPFTSMASSLLLDSVWSCTVAGLTPLTSSFCLYFHMEIHLCPVEGIGNEQCLQRHHSMIAYCLSLPLYYGEGGRRRWWWWWGCVCVCVPGVVSLPPNWTFSNRAIMWHHKSSICLFALNWLNLLYIFFRF